MKSKGVSTFILIYFVQIISGQQNALVNSKNLETNNIVSQQQTPQITANTGFIYENDIGNGNSLHNQHQVQMQINVPRSLSNTEEIQQLSELKNQPPRLQQLLLPQQPLQIKQSLRLQQPIQLQQKLQADQALQSLQPSPLQQTLQSPQILQQQQPLQAQQAFYLQPQIGVQQNSLLQVPTYQENVDIGPTADLRRNKNFQSFPDTQLNLNLVPTDLQANMNNGQPLNTGTCNVQPQQNSITYPVETVSNPRPMDDKALDDSTIRYNIVSQQSPPSSPTNSAIVSQNPSIALIPSYSIKPGDQTYTRSYSYINPSTEIQPSIVERTKTIHSVPALPPVLTIPTPLVQNSNTQAYYYNPQSGDLRQNVYVNKNLGFNYPQQSPISVTAVQSHPTAALVPSRSSIFTSIPLSLIQAPSVFPQYTVSSPYPVNTVLAPTYTSQTSKPSNLKSFLPLIFNLLKEKISSSGCHNCPNQCKNECNNNKPEVSSGYSSKKHYGALSDDALLILDNVSKESEGAECLRDRKNCLKIEKVIPEISEETQEDEDSDEEESEDEDDEE